MAFNFMELGPHLSGVGTFELTGSIASPSGGTITLLSPVIETGVWVYDYLGDWASAVVSIRADNISPLDVYSDTPGFTAFRRFLTVDQSDTALPGKLVNPRLGFRLTSTRNTTFTVFGGWVPDVPLDYVA